MAKFNTDPPADDAARILNPPITVDNVLGQEATHEMKHNTRSNYMDNYDPEKKEVEPNESEIRAIQQTGKYN